MEKIYRLRPINNHTLDELRNPYLWFSKPKYFDDKLDANINAFIESDELVSTALKRQLVCERQIAQLIENVRHFGICCFTKTLPDENLIKEFPDNYGSDFICVEYNKSLLEESIIKKHSNIIPHGFYDVEYHSCGAELEKCDENHFLKERNDSFSVWLTTTFKDIKAFDDFVFKLLTTKGEKYKNQNETRFIISPKQPEYRALNKEGYNVEISREAINAIYTHGSIDTSFLNNIGELNIPIFDYS